jgi:MRG-binding protein
MPPRKKAKASAASTPLADALPKTPQDSGGASQPQEDAWADDQETQLFKSMMKWKPTGMHKHFRMISIHADMRSHGFASDDALHTRIPGIWRKLHELYDLHALDERENAYVFSEDPDPTDPAEAHDIPNFELPEDEFGELMWERHFHGPESLAASSPPAIPIDDERSLYQPGLGLLKDLPHLRSQRPESVAEATPTPKEKKTTRASRATTKGAKGAKGQAAKNSKAQSAASDSADEEEAEDDEEESTAESEEDPAPSTRRTNRSAAKARPAPKRTRKR